MFIVRICIGSLKEFIKNINFYKKKKFMANLFGVPVLVYFEICFKKTSK